jgi:hypothetical protein
MVIYSFVFYWQYQVSGIISESINYKSHNISKTLTLRKNSFKVIILFRTASYSIP